MRMVFFCGKVSDEIGGGNETDPIFKNGLFFKKKSCSFMCALCFACAHFSGSLM